MPEPLCTFAPVHVCTAYTSLFASRPALSCRLRSLQVTIKTIFWQSLRVQALRVCEYISLVSRVLHKLWRLLVHRFSCIRYPFFEQNMHNLERQASETNLLQRIEPQLCNLSSQHTHRRNLNAVCICYMYQIHFFAHQPSFLFRPRVFSRALGWGVRRGAACTLGA